MIEIEYTIYIYIIIYILININTPHASLRHPPSKNKLWIVNLWISECKAKLVWALLSENRSTESQSVKGRRQSYIFTSSKLCFHLVKAMLSPRQYYVFTLLMHSFDIVYTRLQLSKSYISYTWRWQSETYAEISHTDSYTEVTLKVALCNSLHFSVRKVTLSV